MGMSNMGPTFKVYRINNETNQNIHFITTLKDLYLRETKGSQMFRGVFNYDSPVDKINLHIERWEKILPGYKICPGEMQCTYQSLQNKYFPKYLLDLKARLILRKIQFKDTLFKWAKEKSTQRCHMCQEWGVIL